MYNQQGYGGYNYPNQYQGGMYNANGDYYNKGNYYDNYPNDRYNNYGQQQGGYSYGQKGHQGDNCMEQCLACMAALCCCCFVCDVLTWFFILHYSFGISVFYQLIYFFTKWI